MKKIKGIPWLVSLWLLAGAMGANAQQKKPNILVIFGDDIGMWNVSAYTHGMMGRTPNIDSIATHRHAVHRPLWSAELHSRPCGIHYRANARSHRHDNHWDSGLNPRHPEGRSPRWRKC